MWLNLPQLLTNIPNLGNTHRPPHKCNSPPNYIPLGRLNMYMQRWDPPVQSPRLSFLNNDMIRMINTMRKYNTNLEALQIAHEINAHLPAWYLPRTLYFIAFNFLL